jgi:hypothetical protein
MDLQGQSRMDAKDLKNCRTWLLSAFGNLSNVPGSDRLKNRKLSRFMDVLRKIMPRNKQAFMYQYIFKEWLSLSLC